ncbi:MAG: PEGA domain-containing protein [Myxococcota bacterium]
MALLALAVLSLSDFEPGLENRLRAAAAAVGVAGESSTASPVNVQVNARPWARVRIDGVELGATPLSHRLTPGVYRLEAEFADGKRIERKIDVRAESRFVSLP